MNRKALSYCLVGAFFAMLLLLWEGLAHFNSHLAFVLPAPSKIALALYQRPDRFLLHTLVTFKEMAGGFLLAFVLAFPLAALMYFWNTLRMIFQPLFIIIQCVPMFTLAPIMVIWFGWSYAAIVLPTALMIFFPMTMTIYKGLCATPQHYLDYFKVNQASSWQTFTQLQLPWALPHICAGFRISAAIAGIGAVAGEWAGGQQGLGMLMLESRRGTDLETTFAALFCLTLLSLSLYLFMTEIEKQLVQRKRSFIKSWKFVVGFCLILGSYGLYISRDVGHAPQATRVLLDWLPNPNHVPLYVGIEKGFFAKRDIPLAIQKLSDPADGVTYLTSGQAEIALYYMPSALYAAAHGAKIQAIASLIKEPLNALIYREGEMAVPIDLNGKVIGYCIDGTEVRCLDVLLRFTGVLPKEKRNVTFDLVSTLGAKQVDAIYGAYWNIESEHLRSLGIPTKHFSVTDLGMPTYYELVFLARQLSEQTASAYVAKFKSALQESIDYCQKNPQEAFDIYVKANPDKAEKAVAWEKKAWQLTLSLLAPDQQMDVGVWQAYHDWQVEHQIVKDRIDVSKLIAQ